MQESGMTQDGHVYENNETPQQAELASKYLGLLRAHLAAIDERWESPPRPEAGSALMAVDRLNPYETLSQLIHHSIVVSLDNVRTTLTYIEKTNEIPMTALYSMIAPVW